jgi:hypothetical protein
MKHLFFTLLLATLCAATSYGQTIKSLGYNTTNGQVIADTGTNALTFTNDIDVRAISADSLFIWDVINNTFHIDLFLQNSAIYFVGSNGLARAGITRTNLGLPLAALTNTSNVTAMRALSGSTNTNHPFSGSVSVVGTNNTNTLVFSNGILQSVQ